MFLQWWCRAFGTLTWLCFDQGFCNHVFTWSAREWIDNGRTIDHERSALGTSLGVFLCSTFIPDAKGEDTSGSS